MNDDRYIAAHASGDIVWIDMMAIPKSERGKGAGRADYLKWEQSLPPDVTRVQIFASDTGAGPSAAFWEKMGFSYQYEGENLDYESTNRMWKGVNGHATPPTVNVDDEDEEDRLAAEDKPAEKPASSAEMAFQRWFADSVVRDATGAPLVVYHGTLKDFSTFKPSESGMIFTTPSAEIASMYGSRHALGKDSDGHCVMPLYVSCKNPFDANRLEHVNKVVGLVDSVQLAVEMEALSQSPWDPEQALRWLRKGEWQTMECKATVDALKAGGFDGAYVHEMGVVSLAVFDPRQLKSAIANSGAFDPQDPDITDRRALAASQALAWLQQGKKVAPRA